MCVRSGPGPDNKLLVESYKAKRGSSADGLVVGHLARKARDAGLGPAQCYTFHLYEKFTPEKIIIYLENSLYKCWITFIEFYTLIFYRTVRRVYNTMPL